MFSLSKADAAILNLEVARLAAVLIILIFFEMELFSLDSFTTLLPSALSVILWVPADSLPAAIVAVSFLLLPAAIAGVATCPIFLSPS